jgi:DNA-binding transcriptional LysR family regulator
LPAVPLLGSGGDLETGGEGVWRSVNPQFKLLSDNGQLLRQACLGGAGISAFYNFHIQDDLNFGRLVRVLPEFELPPRDIFAIIPDKKIIRPQAKVFIDFVRRLLGRADGGCTPGKKEPSGLKARLGSV